MRSIDDQTESCRCFSSHSQRLVEFGVFLFCRQKCTACSGTQLRTTSPLRVHSFQKKSTTHPQYQSAEEFRFQLSLFIVSFYFIKLNHFLGSTVRSNNIAERVIVDVVVNVVVVVVKFVLIHVELLIVGVAAVVVSSVMMSGRVFIMVIVTIPIIHVVTNSTNQITSL